MLETSAQYRQIQTKVRTEWKFLRKTFEQNETSTLHLLQPVCWVTSGFDVFLSLKANLNLITLDIKFKME